MRYPNLFALIRLSLTLFLVGTIGCGVTPTGERVLPPDDVVLAENTKQVADDGPLHLESSDGDALHFTSSGGSGLIAEGDILLGTEDGGYLRHVDSVTEGSGGSLNVQTSHTAMTEAIEEGQFSGSTPINPDPNDATGKWQQMARVGANGELDLSGIELINQPGLRVQITEGEVYLSGGVDWDIDISRFRLQYFETVADGRLDLDLDVQVDASAAGHYSEESQVFRQSKPFLAGVVAGRVIVTIYAGIEADVSAEGTLSTGLDSSTGFEAGAYWNGSWHPIADRLTEFNTHDWTWNIEGTVGARAYVRPEIEVEFYGVVGPGLDIEPYLDLEGSLEMPSCLYDWDLRVGVASHANFRAGILDWDLVEYQATLFDWSRSIAGDEGDLCPADVYCLTTSVQGDGDVSLNPNDGCYDDGTRVTITALAADGWYFDHWEEDAFGTGSTTTVTMNGDRHVVAVFEEESECRTDGDCAFGEECVSGACEPPEVGCTNDADCEQDEECVDGECVAQSGADLELSGLSMTRSSSSARTFTSCGFDIINNGPTALSSEGVFVEYYLSDDTTFGDSDDRKIGDTSFTLSIASGATYPIALSSTGLGNMTRHWTEGLVSSGSYYVYAEVSISDGAPVDPTSGNDYDRTFGTISYTGEATGADLALMGLSVARSSTSARTFTNCGFDIINNGPTGLSSEGVFVEYYLSDDATFGDSDDRKIGDTGFTLSIASGATYPIQLSSTGLGNMTRNWTEGLVSNGEYYVYASVEISDGSPSDPAAGNDYDRTSGTISYTGEGAGGEGASADFSQPKISGTIDIFVGSSFRWNDYYQIWRIENDGGGFSGEFNLAAGGTYQLIVDHTASAAGSCPGGGYSPVTIRVNGTVVADCWDPAENNGGSHGSVIDEWSVDLNAGLNTVEWTACDLCTHYWIRTIEFR